MMKLYLALVLSFGVGISIGGCGIFDWPIANVSQSVPSPSSSPSPAVPAENSSPIDPLTDFPHQSIELSDEVEPGSDFDQFRQALRQAIAQRDAEFVTDIIPPEGVSIGFGSPAKLEELGLDDPDAFFWQILYKAMSHGCDRTHDFDFIQPDAASDDWICPNITSAFYEQYPPPPEAQGIAYEMSQVIVVGKDVDVFATPEEEGSLVARLSNEVVTFDQTTWDNLPDEVKLQQATSLDGWTPIILPNDQTGFVSNRHAYRPLDARVVFGSINEQWQILHIPAGD